MQSWALVVRGDIEAGRAKTLDCLKISRESEESPVFDGLALWATAQADLAEGVVAQAVPLLEEVRRLTATDHTWAALPALTLAQVAVDLDDRMAAAAVSPGRPRPLPK